MKGFFLDSLGEQQLMTIIGVVKECKILIISLKTLEVYDLEVVDDKPHWHKIA